MKEFFFEQNTTTESTKRLKRKYTKQKNGQETKQKGSKLNNENQKKKVKFDSLIASGSKENAETMDDKQTKTGSRIKNNSNKASFITSNDLSPSPSCLSDSSSSSSSSSSSIFSSSIMTTYASADIIQSDPYQNGQYFDQ